MQKIKTALEITFLLVAVTGIILKQVGIQVNVLILIGLLGLAGVFFLNAYSRPQKKEQQNGPMGFMELLASTILPKVIWIGMSVILIGILFYVMKMGQDSYLQMLYIGSLSTALAFVIMSISKATGLKDDNTVAPILLRAALLLIISVYILFG